MTRTEAPTPSLRWHSAGRHLWLGTATDEDVAVIEKDGRYAAIDALGRVRGVFPDLVLAQVALASPRSDGDA